MSEIIISISKDDRKNLRKQVENLLKEQGKSFDEWLDEHMIKFLLSTQQTKKEKDNVK